MERKVFVRGTLQALLTFMVVVFFAVSPMVSLATTDKKTNIVPILSLLRQSGPAMGLQTIRAWDDQETLTLEMKGDLPQASHPWFVIDADNDPETGYTRGNIHGAEYLVQSNGLFRYPDNGTGWHWDRISSVVTVEEMSTTVRTRIPLSLINSPDTIHYTGVISSADWSKESSYPQMVDYQVGGPRGDNVAIFIIGASTEYIVNEVDQEVHEDQTPCTLEGWGELLPEVVNSGENVFNYALPGASAASFMLSPAESGEDERLYGPNRDHYWAKTREKMVEQQESGRRGFLLIQFGGNDGWRLLGEDGYPPGRDYDKDGDIDNDDNEVRWQLISNDFKGSLVRYVDEARDLQFTPVLITVPNSRSRGENGRIQDGRAPFPTYTKELAHEKGVRVLDLHEKTMVEYNRYDDTELNNRFGGCYRGNGSRDYTHFEEQGARTVAGWMRDLACEEGGSALCQQFNH